MTNPELAPQPSHRLWIWLSALPSLLFTVTQILCLLAYVQQWGGSTRAAYVMALFSAEVCLVLAAAGLLCYLRVTPKTTVARWLARINWGIVLYAVVLGLYLFLG